MYLMEDLYMLYIIIYQGFQNLLLLQNKIEVINFNETYNNILCCTTYHVCAHKSTLSLLYPITYMILLKVISTPKSYLEIFPYINLQKYILSQLSKYRSWNQDWDFKSHFTYTTQFMIYFDNNMIQPIKYNTSI